MENRITIALQKSGRLAEDSTELLTKCGLKIRKSKDQLFCRLKEMPIDVLFLRDDDIPLLIEQGECDLGIVGRNLMTEISLAADKPLPVDEIMPLGFSKCRLSIAAPQNLGDIEISELNGHKIATSYPALLGKFLEENSIDAKVIFMSGAVEIAPRMGMADTICDLVSTGATLAANGLKEAATVLESEALLVRRADKLSGEKEQIIARLVERIAGVIRARKTKYIMLNAPKDAVEAIASLIPGCDSPTIMPLADPSMVAMHAVCSEDVFWDTMEKIKAAGGKSVLVVPIEKMLD